MDDVKTIFSKREANEITFTHLMEETLKELSHDDELHAFLFIRNADELMADAKAADNAWDEGQRKPLLGIPIAIKDNMCVTGLPCTCGSKILEHFVAPYDATAVKKLKDAGAIIVGKTNLDEFAMGSSSENSAFGPTRNPLDKTCSPGGSSGGSAAAVASGMSLLALGSDTGGSVRQPAAFTGTFGFKPSYGAISRYGLVAFASSLDQIGVLAKHPEDVILASSVLFGQDPMDSTSRDIPMAPQPEASNVKRVGIVKEIDSNMLDKDVKHAYDSFINYLSRTYEVVEISIPHWEEALAAYYFIAPAEASSNLSRYDGVRYGTTMEAENYSESIRKTRNLFGEEVKRRILLGSFALSAGYKDALYEKANYLRQWLVFEFDQVFQNVDMVLTPTTPTPPFKLGEIKDPLDLYKADLFTTPANLAYLPAINMPYPFQENKKDLPIGLQFIAPFGEDHKLLSFINELWQGAEEL
ncbi:Asp-tRNA(Asn)/Glu-tRNA(Gln) amidotransferase subunit GatA [Coprothermobacter platensis]|uniref:Asp-tRNA(Asn)/Glu-tRNA(Gln) amidotransferase subunit GatA n=1 Tax=Coprothermobacter platensis TaxID=108819 RepID=UPI00037FA064|nr:Asp-tRNA(Asn)/Glu-tRNA(Gln) amidotransferase subunit GatA [Coprothermobacter platensis]